MDSVVKSDRRAFLKQLGFVSIGFSMAGTRSITKSLLEEESPDRNSIDSWLQFREDGKVLVYTGKSELGQGLSVAIRQVAAEELNTTMDQVEVHLAETDVTPDEGYTAGSRSMESSAMSVRYAAATAREILIDLAAKKWNLKTSNVYLENGQLIGGGQKAKLKQILEGQQIRGRINRNISVRGKNERRLVGQPIPRESIEKMVKGETYFIQDLRFPRMIHGRIIRPKSYGAELTKLDTSTVESQDGFLMIVKDGSFIGVLAEEEYQAVQMKKALEEKAQWSNGERLPRGVDLKEHIRGLTSDSNTDESRGNISSLDNGNNVHSASYFKPYIMHASNGPSCAIALYENGEMNVWSHTQGVYPQRSAIAELLDLSEDQVHVKSVPGSGCYGHNGADDVAAEAAILAKNYPGRHIRLQWMREDEHGWEPFGTAMLMDLKASLNSSGKITAWSFDLWSDDHSTRPRGNGTNLLPSQYITKNYRKPGGGFRGGATRNAEPYYSISNLVQKSHIFKGPLRVSALRGLGASANVFAIESFMEELADKAEIDPLEFRLNQLDDSRAREVIKRLQANIGRLGIGANQGIGYAFSRYKNSASYFAMATLIEVGNDQNIQLKKMWGVIDAGECINPDGLKNQTEGGMLQATSWAMMEDVKYDENHISSTDWSTYPMLRFPNIPEIQVEVIDRPNEAPLGAGEAAQGPAMAALANAYFNATGKRVRDLPILS